MKGSDSASGAGPGGEACGYGGAGGERRGRGVCRPSLIDLKVPCTGASKALMIRAQEAA